MYAIPHLDPSSDLARLLPVATCIDAFDADGQCVCPELPWSDVSAFACADERASILTRQEFLQQAQLPDHLAGRELVFMSCEGILAIHDLEEDVHYFFG
jgi:hypothetical protein